MADYDDPRPSSEPTGSTSGAVAKDDLITLDRIMTAPSGTEITNRKGKALTPMVDIVGDAQAIVQAAVDAVAADTVQNTTDIAAIQADYASVLKAVSISAGTTVENVMLATNKLDQIVGYIHDAGEQVTYSVPVDAQGGFIDSVVGGKLYLSGGGTYTLETINKSGVIFETIADIDLGNSIGGPVTLLIGDTVIANDYATGNDAGVLFFKVVSAGTGVDDGGKYIDLPSLGLQLQQNLRTPYNVKAWGAVGDTSVDSTRSFNNAMSYNQPVYATVGNYKITSPLETTVGGGIIGDGEATQLIRFFSGGQMIRHAGGNQLKSPIILENFSITTDASITVADGDTGVDIGYSAAWGGRGSIRNILILGQWDGFKWKGGTVNPIRDVQVQECKGDGFVGVNPRGELYGCLSQFNEGNGYSIYAESSGETGVRLVHCGTFANQEFGLILDAGAGIVGANVWTDKFSSSFDGRGGFYCDKDYTQVYMDNLFVEYAGYARNFKPAFTSYPFASGVTFEGVSGSVTASNFSGVTVVQNCSGAGLNIRGTSDVTFSSIISHGNGKGLQGGATQNGINLQDNTRMGIDTFKSGALSASQAYDIALVSTDNTGYIGSVQCSSIYDTAPSKELQWIGDVFGVPPVIVASSSVPDIPAYSDFIGITGTTNIDSIAPSWRGRQITLKFSDALTVSDGNALSLAGAFVTSAGSTLTLQCDGLSWNEISRSSN